MIDLKYTNDGDLDLSGGDVQYANSDYQHQRGLLVSQKGDYKEWPAVGVDIINYAGDTEPEALLRAIKKEFASDGMKVAKVVLNADGEIETDAAYNEAD